MNQFYRAVLAYGRLSPGSQHILFQQLPMASRGQSAALDASFALPPVVNLGRLQSHTHTPSCHAFQTKVKRLRLHSLIRDASVCIIHRAATRE